ncbi:MAG: tetratricopeptide repeat protein, partial [Candidatus Binatales bacterium]
MNLAYVFGPLGRAVYIGRDGAPATLEFDGGDKPIAFHPNDLQLSFDCCPEYLRISNEGLTIEHVRQVLVESTVSHDALSMTIAGLDSDLSPETRRLSIEAAEELLQDGKAYAFTRARLLGCPMPEPADVKGAIRISGEAQAGKSERLYAALSKVGETITSVRSEWKKLASQILRDRDTEETLETLLLDLGVFADFAEALARRDRREMGNLVVGVGTDARLIEKFPRIAQVLNSLSLRLSQFIDVPEHPGGFEAKEEDGGESVDRIAEMISSALAEAPGRGRERRTGRQALERVQSQIGWIAGEIRAGLRDRALNDVKRLVKMQLQNSSFADLAKTLSQLGLIAARAGNAALGTRLLGYAFLLNVEDPFIWTTWGEILRAYGRPAEALSAYDQAVGRFPTEVVAYCGRAEVLREIGRLDEALRSYDEAVKRFPGEVVAGCGRAEVLREMGRLDEA